MPLFRFESSLSLPSILSEMGMPDAFDGRVADFSGITDPPSNGLSISGAYHRATIEVNDIGTEASAATVIVMMEVSAEVAMDPVHLIVDRPFMFAIVERETGAVLFMGRVLNPKK